jgi:hypothetical protein
MSGEHPPWLFDEIGYSTDDYIEAQRRLQKIWGMRGDPPLRRGKREDGRPVLLSKWRKAYLSNIDWRAAALAAVLIENWRQAGLGPYGLKDKAVQHAVQVVNELVRRGLVRDRDPDKLKVDAEAVHELLLHGRIRRCPGTGI